MHASTKHSDASAVWPGECHQTQTTGRTGALGGYGVAVDHAQRPPCGGVYQQDGGLVRFCAKVPVTWPEASRLKAQQPLPGHRARLDAEDTTSVKGLSHHREYLALTGAVQHKGLAYRIQYVAGLQQGAHLVLVEQQQLGMVG